MSAGVVLKIDTEADLDGWMRLLAAVNVDEVYELPGLGVPFPGSIGVENLGQVMNFRETALIVIQPDDGDFVKGETNLEDVEHPLDAIYVFGGTITRLTRNDIRGATPWASVFIPVGDLFPPQAGAMVLWDRYSKRAGL